MPVARREAFEQSSPAFLQITCWKGAQEHLLRVRQIQLLAGSKKKGKKKGIFCSLSELL
jgi:hypothetical protein